MSWYNNPVMYASRFEICPHADLLPADYVKQGAGALVEAAVSDIVQDLESMDERFGQLYNDVDATVRGSGATGDWLRARLKNQGAVAVGSFAASLRAMKAMTAWHQEHGTITPAPEVDFDPHEYAPPGQPVPANSELYATAFRGACWIRNAARTFLDESKADPAHPYHRLHHHLEQGWQNYTTTFGPYYDEQVRKAEQRGIDFSQTSRAATMTRGAWEDPSNYPYDHFFIASHVSNIGLGIDLMTASAVHHIRLGGGHSAQDLSRAARSRLEHMRWMASINRHSDVRQAEVQGLQARPLPHGATNLLASLLTSAESVPELMRPFMQYRAVHDPQFLPAQTLYKGPHQIPGTCAGDVNVRLATDDQRLIAADFFGETGLPGFGRETLSSATFVLATSLRISEVVTYPRIVAFLQSVSA